MLANSGCVHWHAVECLSGGGGGGGNRGHGMFINAAVAALRYTFVVVRILCIVAV